MRLVATWDGRRVDGLRNAGKTTGRTATSGTIATAMTPTSHYTQVNSLRIHYLAAGTPDPNTPPILLLHGFPTSSHLYRNILPELGKTHRAIALDLPGYGLSDKPLDAKYNLTFYETILEGFLDALDIHDTDLVVHDLGGPVDLYWALRHPDRVYKDRLNREVLTLANA